MTSLSARAPAPEVSSGRWRESAPRALRWLVIAALLLGIAVLIATQPFRYGVGAVGGLVVLLISVVRPEMALAMVAFSVPFGELAAVSVGGLTLTATEPLVGLALLGWALRFVTGKETRLRIPWLFVIFALFIALLAQSVAVSSVMRIGAKELIKWTEAALLFLIAANVLKTPMQVGLVVGAFLSAGTLSALQGWYQFVARQGPEGFIIAGRFLRAYGTFGQPNPYAGYLNLILPIAFAVVLIGLTRGANRRVKTATGHRGLVETIVSQEWAQFLVAGGALLIMGLAEGMSLSRAAWFGLVAAGLAILSFRSRRTFIALVIGLVVVLLSSLLGTLDLLPATLVERVSLLGDYFRIFDINEVELTPENWSIVERMANWQTAWDMFLTQPWFGIGPGAYQSLWSEFAPIDWVLRSAAPPHAHNFYLNMLAEGGIVGLTGLLILTVSMFVYTSRRIRDGQLLSSRADQHTAFSLWAHPLAIALGALGVILALSVHNLFDNIFVHGMTAQVGLTLGLVEGSWIAATAGREENSH